MAQDEENSRLAPQGRLRLDHALVARGLIATRQQAQAAIDAGRVRVAGVVVWKAAQRVDADAVIEAEPAWPWVSRGGVKLAHGLDRFGVDPAGRACLDIGASTGGFTHVLLARGAARVVAVDVGRNQLAAAIAADPRVIAREGLDVRRLTAADLPEPPCLVVADVSFIGLKKALAPALPLCAPSADLVALIKPQFEAGPGRAPGWDEAARVAEAAAAGLDGLAGFAAQGLIDSPIPGGDGAREFLLHARRRP